MQRRGWRYLARFMNLPWWRFRCWWPLIACLPRSWAYRVAGWTARLDVHDEQSETARFLQGMAQQLPQALPVQASNLWPLMHQRAQEMAYDQLDAYTMDRWVREQVSGQAVHWRVEGTEVLDHALQAGRQAGGGVILVIAHHGRFFQFGPGLGLAGYPFSMLTTAIAANNPAYQNDSVRRYWQRKLATTLRHAQGHLVTTQDPLRAAYRLLQQGQILLVALDGAETNAAQRVSIPAWGGALHVPAGIWRMAEYTHSHLVYGSVRTATDGALELALKSLPEDGEAAVIEALNYLREDIEQCPESWWQWPSLPVFWQASLRHVH